MLKAMQNVATVAHIYLVWELNTPTHTSHSGKVSNIINFVT